MNSTREVRGVLPAILAFAIMSGIVWRAMGYGIGNLVAKNLVMAVQAGGGIPDVPSIRIRSWPMAIGLALRGHTGMLETLCSKTTNRWTRNQRLDQYLTAAACLELSPVQYARVVAVAHRSGADSAIGYTRFGVSLIGRFPGTAEQSLRLAQQTTVSGAEQSSNRSRAGYLRGCLLEGADPLEARKSFQLAVQQDPNDESGGYAWTSAAMLTKMQVRLGECGEAERTLREAHGMATDLYHRRSETFRLRAALAVRQDNLPLALSLLRTAIREDRDYEPLQSDMQLAASLNEEIIRSWATRILGSNQACSE